MIRSETRIKGTLDSKLKTLNERLGRRVEAGVKAVAEFLHVESMLLVPVDTSALLESSQVRTVGSGLATTAIVGYGIKGQVFTRWSESEGQLVTRIPYDYAIYVHEIPAAHAIGTHDFLRTPRNTKISEMRAVFNTAAIRG